jgi:Na+-transporting methylmalonyl-CoA/oxaloacetate decarboxylase gamma subunit
VNVIAIWVGLGLTIYGMALVFLLLGLLWGLIALAVHMDQGEPAAEDADATEEETGADNADGEDTVTVVSGPPAIAPEVLAAVVIACRAHRMTHRQQAAPEMRTHMPGSLPSRWVGTGRTRQNRSWAPGGRFA